MKVTANDRAVAFVVARLSSSRLPGKQLRQIGEKPIIGWILDELAQAEQLDQVVIATVAEPDNRPLRDIAGRYGVELFEYDGEVDDVVGRLRHAADYYRADICLLISADCPLVYGPSVDELVEQMRAVPESDHIVLSPDDAGNPCLLEGVLAGRVDAWRRAEELSDRPELREHQFPVLHQYPNQFRALPVTLSQAVYGPHHRLSVDTWADLEFMQTLYQHLMADGLPFRLPEAVAMLASKPELKAINSHVHQRRLVETVHSVLFVVDAGGAFGYGHLMRCRELAGQLVERLGWPVTFLLDDVEAMEQVHACGFRVMWGALGRDVRNPPDQTEVVGAEDAVRGQGVLLIDISLQRKLAPGWRRRVATSGPVVMIGREDAAALEADLIVNPGCATNISDNRNELPSVIDGMESLILRREIRRFQGLGLAKDIDVLVDIEQQGQLSWLREPAVEMGWRVEWVETVSPDFPGLLARSRVFLGGDIQNLYEAVLLGAYPGGPAQSDNVKSFYQYCGLSPLWDDDKAAITISIEGVLRQPVLTAKPLVDGTPAIVDRLAVLREGWDSG